MKKSGLADSPLFSVPTEADLPGSPSPISAPSEKKIPKTIAHVIPKKAKEPSPPRNHDTVIPTNHATTVSRYHDAIIELVRKAVKEFGKEAATHRFTQDEKRGITDIIYTYRNQGVKTSENEIARIAVNFIIQDYSENGENSVLDKVLKALRE